MAKKAPKPDYHHMDLKDLRAYRVNLEAESVKKLYKAYRDTFEISGQRGKMPEATLLHIAATPATLAIPKAPRPVNQYKRPHLKRKEVENGSEQSDSNIRTDTEGSCSATELESFPRPLDF